MVWFIYVLRCSDKSLYVGLTNNLQRRLKEHLAGKVSWTRSRLPAILVYSEQVGTRIRAREREKYLKSGCGKEWLKAILKSANYQKHTQ